MVKDGTQERQIAAERADDIRAGLARATNHLNAAYAELQTALRNAGQDYQFNDQVIGDLAGAVRVAHKQVIWEEQTWRDYADARRKALSG